MTKHGRPLKWTTEKCSVGDSDFLISSPSQDLSGRTFAVVTMAQKSHESENEA